MDQSQQITAALKQFLKEKGVIYAMLAQTIRLSEASVKRLFSTSAFTLKRPAQICEALDVDIYTLAKRAAAAKNPPSSRCHRKKRWRRILNCSRCFICYCMTGVSKIFATNSI